MTLKEEAKDWEQANKITIAEGTELQSTHSPTGWKGYVADAKAHGVVWHKYPEEKPTKKGAAYLVYLKSLPNPSIMKWGGSVHTWPAFDELIEYWTEVPARPKSES